MIKVFLVIGLIFLVHGSTAHAQQGHPHFYCTQAKAVNPTLKPSLVTIPLSAIDHDSFDMFVQVSFRVFSPVNMICNNAKTLAQLNQDIICAGVKRPSWDGEIPKVQSTTLKYTPKGYMWENVKCTLTWDSKS